ncbi:hypothetical protein [Kitasatospora sp. HPMI-4]|uniref:hypothetical protein n=1 Tax=Kitasatospora sp. HPMI-4 TaxID=3448443 RepID=UPI003F1B1256
MNKMLRDAKAAAAAGKAPHQLQGGGLRKAGDSGIDPAAPATPEPAGGAPAKKATPAPGGRRSVKKAATKAQSERVPFGSYLPRDLHRRFKLVCVADGIEMQDALEQAVAAWVAKHKPTI